jgi:hypothetical protein
VPDEIHDLVARVVQNPDAGQSSPSVFLGPRARPSTPPKPRPWSGSSSPGRRSAPGRRSGWVVSSARKRPRRSRITPAASGRRLWAASPIHRRASKSEYQIDQALLIAVFRQRQVSDLLGVEFHIHVRLVAL